MGILYCLEEEDWCLKREVPLPHMLHEACRLAMCYVLASGVFKLYAVDDLKLSHAVNFVNSLNVFIIILI